MALDPGERLFAGVVLIVVGLVGLVYRLTGYGMVIGDIRTGSMFYSGGYSLLSLIITAVFIIVVLLGVYIVYDTIRKDSKTLN
ncbi:MAG: hypothetical protein O8C64_08005 [Candidatus Methanoperedens sp.]|nr:hypothetical protein [Candidatus Methanoperedens sp.]MCZ7403940.1 hypothetical protein [Candidatus Methanoperedens sp.]